jgi:hypothetical protein
VFIAAWLATSFGPTIIRTWLTAMPLFDFTRLRRFAASARQAPLRRFAASARQAPLRRFAASARQAPLRRFAASARQAPLRRSAASARPAPVVLTILGWTPGLHSLVTSRRLPCGCLTGTYLTWRGSLVAIVDSHVDGCVKHRANLILWQAGGPALAPLDDPSSFADPA